MRRIPAWIVILLVALGIFLTIVGWHEHHHVGYVPFGLGVIWILFGLSCAPRMWANEPGRHGSH